MSEQGEATGKDCSFLNHSLLFVFIFSSDFLFLFQNSPWEQALGLCLFPALGFSARRRPPTKPYDKVHLLRTARLLLTGALHPLSKHLYHLGSEGRPIQSYIGMKSRKVATHRRGQADSSPARREQLVQLTVEEHYLQLEQYQWVSPNKHCQV